MNLAHWSASSIFQPQMLCNGPRHPIYQFNLTNCTKLFAICSPGHNCNLLCKHLCRRQNIQLFLYPQGLLHLLPQHLLLLRMLICLQMPIHLQQTLNQPIYPTSFNNFPKYHATYERHPINGLFTKPWEIYWRSSVHCPFTILLLRCTAFYAYHSRMLSGYFSQCHYKRNLCNP